MKNNSLKLTLFIPIVILVILNGCTKKLDLACLFWAFRHIIQEALWETSDAGWKQSLHTR